KSARGTIDRPIGRDGRDRKRMSVQSARSRTALTGWRVRERLPGATLLEVAPETGRTHQIRVHLASLGHPIVGDAIYGGRRRAMTAPAGVILAACPRQALHAARLAFDHPATGARTTIEAPLPSDLSEVVDALRKLARTLVNSS